MPFNTNTINKIRYTLYAPIYDSVAKVLEASRKKSIEEIQIKAGQNVLIVGGGTGLDFQYLPSSCNLTATDLTLSMVSKMRARKEKLQLNAEILVMDGHRLEFEEQSFDVVILHLILAVIPNPKKAMKEAERVLKPGGTIAVFDKFLPEHQKPSIIRKIANQFTRLLFSDINRKIGEIQNGTKLIKTHDTPANFGGVFRIIRFTKP